MELDRYRDFVTTVERGSITAAARALHTSRPTLSRRLAQLEEALGLVLLHRTTRSLALTPAGQHLYERVAPLIRDLVEVERATLDERDEVSGLLRVSVPPVLAPDLAEVLVDLGARHPRLRVALSSEVRKAAMRDEGIEVALRAGAVDDPDLISRRIGRSDVSAVASPSYLAASGPPRTVAELADHRLLLGHGADDRPQRWWPLRTGGVVPVTGVVTSNDQRLLARLAVAGGGIALLSSVTATPHLEDGSLVRVLPEVLGMDLPLHVVLTSRDRQPARVRAFVDAVAAWAASVSPLLRPP